MAQLRCTVFLPNTLQHINKCTQLWGVRKKVTSCFQVCQTKQYIVQCSQHDAIRTTHLDSVLSDFLHWLSFDHHNFWSTGIHTCCQHNVKFISMDCVIYVRSVGLVYKVIKKEGNTFTCLLRIKKWVYNDVKCISYYESSQSFSHISHHHRLIGYFTINMPNCYSLFKLSCTVHSMGMKTYPQYGSHW